MWQSSRIFICTLATSLLLSCQKHEPETETLQTEIQHIVEKLEAQGIGGSKGFASDSAILVGKLVNLGEKKLILKSRKSVIQSQYESMTITPDADGNFRIPLYVPIPMIVHLGLKVEKENVLRRVDQMPLFIEPGDSIHVMIDGDDFINSLEFSGKNADNNQYYKEMQITARKTPRINFTVDLAQFKDLVDQPRESQLRSLLQAIDRYDLSNAFIASCLAEINYGWARSKVMYPSKYKRAHGKENTEITEDYYRFLDDVGLVNTWAVGSSYYLSFLHQYLGLECMKRKIPPHPGHKFFYFWAGNYDLAKEYLSGEPLYWFLACEISNAWTPDDPESLELAEMKFSNFKKSNSYPLYTKLLTSIRKGTLDKANSITEALDFTLPDLEGNDISVSDFKGNVVLLDFWASWCGPCLSNIPNLDLIHERIKNEKVIVLCVSLDKDDAKWRYAIERFRIQGKHVRAGGYEAEAASIYGVSSVPTYILIDSNGKIAGRYGDADPDVLVPKIKELLSGTSL